MNRSPSRFGFDTCYRLKTAKDFSGLRQNRSKFFSQDLIFFYKENKMKHSRLGVSVSKKSGNAVIRNGLKRSVREWFRSSSLKEKNLDLLVVFNKKTSPHNKNTMEVQEQIKLFESKLMKEVRTHG